MTTGGPKKSQLRSGLCVLSCRDRWQPQRRPGWLAFSPRVVGCLLPHGDGCSGPGAPLRARSAPKDVVTSPVLSLTPPNTHTI